MSKLQRCRKPMPEKTMIPFQTSEEAWFWYVRSERSRREGGQPTRSFSMETRPCDPDDVYKSVMDLRRKNTLQDHHLRVLGKFGWRDSPPDPRLGAEEYSFILWDEALDRMDTVLMDKGIVVRHDKRH